MAVSAILRASLSGEPGYSPWRAFPALTARRGPRPHPLARRSGLPFRRARGGLLLRLGRPQLHHEPGLARPLLPGLRDLLRRGLAARPPLLARDGDRVARGTGRDLPERRALALHLHG